MAPGQASPANGLPDFTNCQFRVSSNNSSSTSDQVFRTMTLPAAAATVAPNFTGTPTAGTVGTPYSFAFTGVNQVNFWVLMWWFLKNDVPIFA